MTQRFTQPLTTRRGTNVVMSRRTDVLGAQGIDPAHTLAGAVKAFNQRAKGRSYEQGSQEALFDAVRAFQSRQSELATRADAAIQPGHHGTLPGRRAGLPAGWTAAAPQRPFHDDSYTPDRPPLRPIAPGSYE